MNKLKQQKAARQLGSEAAKQKAVGKLSSYAAKFPHPLWAGVRGRGMTAAFTLAEVLITITIIGVVAALTIPTLISKIEQKVLITSFKKIYANMTVALQATMLQDNYGNVYPCYLPPGENSKGEYSCTQFYNDYLKHLKLIKTETITYLPYKIGTEVEAEGGVVTIGTSYYENGGAGYYKHYLADGSIFYRPKVYYYVHPSEIIVDVNGDKGPNRWGYDVHILRLLKNQMNSSVSYVVRDRLIEKGGMSAEEMINK